MESKIKELLIIEFSDVYCDTCKGKCCEGCYRKNMHWGISDNHASVISKNIVEIIKNS